jgi:hypothetical protein
MKKLLQLGIFLLLPIGAMANKNQTVLVDTVDFWRIQLNKRELLATYPSGKRTPGEAIYFIDKITTLDMVSIYYYTDSPCSDCPSKIELRDGNHNVIKIIEKNFDDTPFLLTGSEVEKILTDNDKVYIYFTGKYKAWRPWTLLGALMVKS